MVMAMICTLYGGSDSATNVNPMSNGATSGTTATIPVSYDKNNNLFFSSLDEHDVYAEKIDYKSSLYFKNPTAYQAEVDQGNCTSQWGKTWNGYKRLSTPAYPNMDTTYWFYTAERDQSGDTPIIRISG